MTTLEARKQLLLTESELNRARLIEEWTDLKMEACSLADHARPVASLIASVTSLAGLFAALRRAWPERSEHTGRNNGRRSLISKMLHGVQTGAALWQAIRRSRAP